MNVAEQFQTTWGLTFGGALWHSQAVKAIETIRAELAVGQFDFTQHAFKRAVERNISAEDIQQAGAVAHVIENYPDDKYTPSLLLLGFTKLRRPLHLQVSCADTPLVRLITVYEPNEAEWSQNYTQRR